MSPTFLSLLLLRATQWSVHSKTLESIAYKHLSELDDNPSLFSSMSLNAFIYIRRFADHTDLSSNFFNEYNSHSIWFEVKNSIIKDKFNSEGVDRLLDSKNIKDFFR